MSDVNGNEKVVIEKDIKDYKVETEEFVPTEEELYEQQNEEVQPLTEDEIQGVEKDFNDLIESLKQATDSVSENVNMGEVKDIAIYIQEAKTRLNQFTSGEEMSFGEKVCDTLELVPFAGKIFKEKKEKIQKERFESATVKEMLNGIFDGFREKNKRMLEMAEMISTMDGTLREHNVDLGLYVRQLDATVSNPPSIIAGYKAKSMSTIASSHLRISNGMIEQIDAIMRSMGILLEKVNTSLPVIESLLKNQLNIAAAINTVNETVNMMGELESLTNTISEKSTDNIQNLIIKVTENSGNGLNIEHIKKSNSKAIEFNKKLNNVRANVQKKKDEDYKILKQCEMDTTNLIADRNKQEMLLIEKNVESSKQFAKKANEAKEKAAKSVDVDKTGL